MSIETIAAGTNTITEYLIVCSDGAVLCDIHDTITRWADATDSLQSVLLVTPDGQTTLVDLHDASDNAGIEWEIVRNEDGELLEYICYTNGERQHVLSHVVYVNGFTAS